MEKDKINFELLENFYRGFGKIFFSIKFLDDSPENFISDSVEQITGYTSAELSLLPDDHHSIICEEDLPAVKKSLEEFESDFTKDSFELSYRINSRSGSLIWVKEFIILDRSENRFSILGKKSIVLEIDEIKKEETALRNLSDSLKELNQSKDKFISIVSHDLRAPFTTLLGFSEILLNEQDISEDERTEYLQYIYDASKSQLNLINCLLDWSRLQTGRIKVEPVRLNVKTLVSTAVAPLTGDAVRKNIDVKIEIPVDLNVNVDERLMSQAVVNLTTNALKFTPEGKEVHLSASRFKEGMIEIVVKDEGLGISEENQSKLFKIDQKFSLVGTNGEKGSGLGLTLVKEIVEKHGGQVWFYSQLGEGSEFHLTVPEAKNRILLVEDDPSVQILYKKFIDNELPDFELKIAGNGYEAIGLYRDFLPTIIITDHDMPLMNGIQLVEAIQKKESSRTIPIIVVSTKLNDDLIKKYSRLGVEKFITKPFENEILIQQIRECLF
ncbi:MAG: ATP-binding protein [Melioribacteraceae bacterium]